MKGLLLKDFYLLIKYCKSAFVIAVIFTIISCIDEGNFLFLIYPCVVTAMLPVSLYAYDERAKWLSYAGTLPYSKAQLVSVKYIISLFMGLFMIAQSSIIIGCHSLLTGKFVFQNFLTSITPLFMITLAPPALILPCVFKFGPEKGRIFYYIIVGIICGVGVALNFTGETPVTLNNRLGTILSLIIVIILFAGSWRLSIRIYNKKELI